MICPVMFPIQIQTLHVCRTAFELPVLNLLFLPIFIVSNNYKFLRFFTSLLESFNGGTGPVVQIYAKILPNEAINLLHYQILAMV